MKIQTISIEKRHELVKNLIGLINYIIIYDYDIAKRHFPITFDIVDKLSSSEIRFLSHKIADLKE